MNQNHVVIRKETPADYRAVEELTRESFWNVYRPGAQEHYVLHCFREDPVFIPELSLVMELDGRLIGHVMYAHSGIVQEDGSVLPLMTFGPISIAPEVKRMGYGTILLRASMEQARAMGAGALAITGNIDFYGKSGFVPASSKGVRYAEAELDDELVPYFLINELTPGYLNGVRGTFKEPAGYFVADRNPEEFAAFDATFPERKMEKLPGQIFE